MIKKQKVYELTTNDKDGYAKWMVRGIKDDDEARAVALRGFGRKYAWIPGGVSYYDDYPSEYGTDWSKVPTKEEFIKKARKHYGNR